MGGTNQKDLTTDTFKGVAPPFTHKKTAKSNLVISVVYIRFPHNWFPLNRGPFYKRGPLPLFFHYLCFANLLWMIYKQVTIAIKTARK